MKINIRTKAALLALLLLLLSVTASIGGCTDTGNSSTTSSPYITSEADAPSDSTVVTETTPETSYFPESTAPDVTDPPQTTASPETTQTPVTTSKPETTAAPETTSAPETTASPAITTAPETTAPPVITTAPETTAPPVIETPGKLLYYENFEKYSTVTGNDAVCAKLGWHIDTPANGAYKTNTSKYTIRNYNGSRRLFISNNESNSTDSYVILLTAAQFGAYHESNYTYQYDLVYTDAYSADRYIAIVSDYNGFIYNSFHFRNCGTANNQIHHNGSWYTYDAAGLYYAANTDSNSIVTRLLGIPYSKSSQAFSGIEVSIRYVVDWTNGNRVYMRINTPGYPGSGKWTLVSRSSSLGNGTSYFSPSKTGGAIALKTGGRQCGYIDNIMIWEGTGDEPEDKSSPLLTSFTTGCSGHRFEGGEDCGNPPVCIYCGQLGSNVKAHTFASVPNTPDSRCTVCRSYSSNISSAWKLTAVPSYSGGTYSSKVYYAGQGIGDSNLSKGSDSQMMIISGTDAQAYRSYLEKLEQYGYTETYTYSCDGNLYAQYSDKDQFVYTYYTSSVSEVRVILDKSSDCSVTDFGYSYEKGASDSTILYQYGVPMNSMGVGGLDTDGQRRINCGMMYVIKLADNSVFIMDGGGYQQFDTAQCDGFMKFLRNVTGIKSGKIRIAGWYISHCHSDHMAGAALFFKKYHSQLTLERVLFNFPSYYSGTDIYMNARGNHSKLISYINKYFPGDNVVFMQIHTGQSFTFADISINVIYTHEDLVDPLSAQSESANDFNNSCSVLKIGFDGKAFFLLGDINKPAMNVILANNSSETLKGDIVQLAHHVYNSLQNLYHKIQASVVLAPQTEGGAVQSTTRKDIIDTAKQYVKNDMVYYGGSRTDGIAVVNGEITHVYTAPIDGGGYTGWSW